MYNVQWPALFSGLKQKLLDGMRGLDVSIEHVGSTAIEELAAKPILDIILLPGPGYTWQQLKKALERMGYEHTGDQGIPGREAFKLDKAPAAFAENRKDWPYHHLYVGERTNRNIKWMLRFRDILLSRTDVKEAYAQLKVQLAEEHSEDRNAYTEAKTAFISGILKQR